MTKLDSENFNDDWTLKYLLNCTNSA